MNSSSRLPRIVSLIAVVSMATVAFAEPPPRNPSDSGAGAGPVPSPGRPGSGYPAPLGRIAITPPDAPPPARVRHREYREVRVSNTVAGDSSVASVQRALKKRGFYSGSVDGEAGGGTRSAIRNFRAENGLGSSTRIDGPLLRALGL